MVKEDLLYCLVRELDNRKNCLVNGYEKNEKIYRYIQSILYARELGNIDSIDGYFSNYDHPVILKLLDSILEVKKKYNIRSSDFDYAVIDYCLNKLVFEGFYFDENYAKERELKTFEDLINDCEIEIYKEENSKYFRVLKDDLRGELIVPEGISFKSEYSKENQNPLGNFSKIIFLDENLKISKEMFAFCKNIREITFLGNIEEIPEKAFFNCQKLEDLHIKTSFLKVIRQEAFAGCKNLEGLHYGPTNIEIIEKAAFFKCENLRYFSFSDDLKEIGDLSFYGTNLGWSGTVRNIQLPEGVKLGKGVFLGIKNLRVYVKRSSVDKILTKDERKIYRFYFGKYKRD